MRPSSTGWLGFISGILVSKPKTWRAIRWVVYAAAMPVLLLVIWIQRHPIEAVLALGLVSFLLLQLWGAKRYRLPSILSNAPVYEETALYRWFDRDQRLLYVGISNHILRRTTQHGDSKEWWRRVASCSVTWLPTRQMALDAESRAIVEEDPVYNIAGAGKRKAWL